jgi:hypothetical protein
VFEEKWPDLWDILLSLKTVSREEFQDFFVKGKVTLKAAPWPMGEWIGMIYYDPDKPFPDCVMGLVSFGGEEVYRIFDND